MRRTGRRPLVFVLSLFLILTMFSLGAAPPAGASGSGYTTAVDDRLIVSLIDRARSCAGPSFPGSSVITRGSYKIVLLFSSGGHKYVPVPSSRQAQPEPASQARLKPNDQPKPAPKPSPDPQPQPKPKPSPEPAQKKPSAAASRDLNADEQRMFELVNSARAKAGLNPLQADMSLVRLARMKAMDMIENSYFDHTSPTYGTPFSMMKSAGISYRYAGENLAGAPSVDTAHTNLMNSPGHRANILNPNYTRVGIGVVAGGPYGRMFVQLFTG